MSAPRLRGVLAPVLTPFKPDLEPDALRLIAHCRWLLTQNAGLALFGTNSEAASLSTGERMGLLDAVLEAGLPAARMLPGTGACALPDALALTRQAVRSGAAGVLVLPPFFYKGVSEDGLFAYYAELIERVADARLRVYLYHIPQVSGIPITLALIARLLGRYPAAVAGVKDSSGDWQNTRALLERFSAQGFDVFPASESMLLRALPLGAAGCISATANLNPAAIDALYRGWSGARGAELQAAADALRQLFQSPSMVAALKQALADYSGDPDWAIVRPPLTALDAAARQTLLAALRRLQFAMPGLEPTEAGA